MLSGFVNKLIVWENIGLTMSSLSLWSDPYSGQVHNICKWHEQFFRYSLANKYTGECFCCLFICFLINFNSMWLLNLIVFFYSKLIILSYNFSCLEFPFLLHLPAPTYITSLPDPLLCCLPWQETMHMPMFCAIFRNPVEVQNPCSK